MHYRVLDDDRPGPPQIAHTLDIGVGGAFVVTASPPPPGTTLELVLQIPAVNQPIVVRAEVRWVRRAHELPSSERGMGVKFAALEVDQLLSLSDYFAALTAKSEAGP